MSQNLALISPILIESHQISQNLTESHQISHNHNVSHQILANLTESHYISPCGTILSGGGWGQTKNPIFFYIVPFWSYRCMVACEASRVWWQRHLCSTLRRGSASVVTASRSASRCCLRPLVGWNRSRRRSSGSSSQARCPQRSRQVLCQRWVQSTWAYMALPWSNSRYFDGGTMAIQLTLSG